MFLQSHYSIGSSIQYRGQVNQSWRAKHILKRPVFNSVLFFSCWRWLLLYSNSFSIFHSSINSVVTSCRPVIDWWWQDVKMLVKYIHSLSEMTHFGGYNNNNASHLSIFGRMWKNIRKPMKGTRCKLNRRRVVRERGKVKCEVSDVGREDRRSISTRAIFGISTIWAQHIRYSVTHPFPSSVVPLKCVGGTIEWLSYPTWRTHKWIVRFLAQQWLCPMALLLLPHNQL